MNTRGKYSDAKLYSGIEYEDGRPLLSEDLHESDDITTKKHSFLLNNIVGSGVLNKPILNSSTTGYSLREPSVVLLDGDIVLVQATDNEGNVTEILKTSDVVSSGINNGLLCIVGWYQKLISSTTLRDYGGVNNRNSGEGFSDNTLGLNISARYQFRWDTILLDKNTYDSQSNMNISLSNRDSNGDIVDNTVIRVSAAKSGHIRIAPRPITMEYALSDLYIIPIIQYDYTNGSLIAVPIKPIKPKGAEVIKNTREPAGDIDEGTDWYNTDNNKLYKYIEGVGFIPYSSLVEYNHYETIAKNRDNPEDVLLDIGIDSYKPTDILQVFYEGLLLQEGNHYSVDHENKRIKLLGFITEIGDIVTIKVISNHLN